MGERLLAGRREEAVDVGLLQPIVGRVQLALNGVDFVGACGAGYQVDAGVALGLSTEPLLALGLVAALIALGVAWRNRISGTMLVFGAGAATEGTTMPCSF
jgi:hypothetical protein